MMNLNRLDENRYYGYAFFLNIVWMVLGPSIFFVIVAATIYKGADPTTLTDPNSLTAYMVAKFISDFAPIILSVIIFRKAFKNRFLEFKKNWINYILIIIIGFASIFLFNIIASIIYQALGIVGTSENQEIIDLALSLPIRPIVIFTVLVIAPVLEEIIFRKFLIKYLKRFKWNSWIPYIISAFVFAAIHLDGTVSDLVFLPVYLILSSFITIGYKFSNDNIYVAMGIHFLNNLLSLVGV